MYSVTGDTTSLVPGFPIRTSSDPRSVDSSPRHNAASHVLHRLPVPRHPPCALKHLQHKHKKILGRIRNCISDTQKHHPPKRETAPLASRCSQPLSTNQTPHPTTKAGQQQPPPHRERPHQRGTSTSGFPHSGRRDSGPVVSKPNSVSGDFLRPVFPHRSARLLCTRPPSTTGAAHPQIRPGHRTPTVWAGLGLVVLLRKEVIQPHLPVRLPCYDFVPIADPTFDGSLPQGVRPPASGVTDFHDVTGGVYKARERIHRSVADLRLLATPTSRGRVADPDPN